MNVTSLTTAPSPDGLIDVRLVSDEGAFRFQISPLMALEMAGKLEAEAQKLFGGPASDEARTHFVQR